MTALEQATENAARYCADEPTGLPSTWCEENLRFDEDDNHGPFSFAGAEYCREIVDDFGRKDVNDSVNVFGSQTRKTGSLMGGVAWVLVKDPSGVTWFMPSIGLAGLFSRKRWMPMLRASEGTKDLIPRGAERHDFKTLDQKLGAASVLFTGSNSPANLSSTPRRRVILDEVDKFDMGSGGEADSINLAEQRTKGQPNPQRFKSSTPTIVEGPIWQEFLKGDMRRYFIPCPQCGRHHPSSKRVVLAWSKEYTVLPKTGNEAYVVWDKAARMSDGQWDLDRVERSARFKCPHCQGDILDAHKTWMNREGVWRPTKKAAAGFVSRQLPSLYACAPETTVGKLAKKFLEQKNSLLGLQGFINGDLAEPYMSQDRQSERIEIVTRMKVETVAEWKKLLSVDCQRKAPLFFFTARAWDGGNSVGMEAGPLDSWADVRSKQLAHNVPDYGVCVDSGFGAKSDAEVYQECAKYGEFNERIIQGQLLKPIHFGWLPTKGLPAQKRWKDKETGLLVPYCCREVDPFGGFADAGKVAMDLLEFSGDFFKDILENLRKGKGGYKWTVEEKMATDEYWRHMDAEIKSPMFNKLTGKTLYQWAPRSKHWPNHIFDCEVLQVAYASYLGLFDPMKNQEEKK
jgi:hypothetical protein